MTKITKKKITDMVSYVTILVHNDTYSDVITDEQLNKMMKLYEETFKGEEELALGFIKEKVKGYVVDLENHLSAK